MKYDFPTVFLSSDQSREFKILAIENGVEDVITKPLVNDFLLAHVKQWERTKGGT